MKTSLIAILTLLSTQAMAADMGSSPTINGIIYHCSYNIYPPSSSPGGQISGYSGTIIPTDALSNPNDTTYLTLAPNEISKVGLEARIWFWDDGTTPPYGEISLHKPGQSAEKVASTDFNYGEIGRLSYKDDQGMGYTVYCSQAH